jgi:tetratricopeptide (TPR) repeat protein/predicted Ser/Thr protein kinase
MPAGAEWPSTAARASALPRRLGRYEIVEAIAGGGMGFVYAGYDPELDRKVALKVVHPRRSQNPGSHARLIKEARALARLDHPNVVKVHDVFSEGEQIVVVMELVAGETLAQWEAAAHRTWREVVAAYIQAGEGLAAAHALDIVHRDFKPSNAVIGSDGRVRVLDFGLARLTDEATTTNGDEPVASGAITQTVPGAIMGTLPFSAPEQLAGYAVSAASDQFSFCVALHRAIEGVAPFAGETVDELLASIRNEPPAIAKNRQVPAWLRALVRRGLSPDPDERSPSMAVALRQLKRARGWKRWRMPLAVAVLVVAAGATSFSMRGNTSTAVPCDGGEAVWDPATRTTTALAIERIGTPYADEVADHVVRRLDHQAMEASDTHRSACLAHRGGASSDPMFDRETSCLVQNIGEFKAAIAVLGQTSATSLSGAPEVVAGLRDPRECLDMARLLAASVPPPELRIQVEQLRQRIATANALRRAGRVAEAEHSSVATIADAETLGYQPAIAEAQLELGRILIAAFAHRRAIPVLRAAMQTALANNLPSLAVEAIARRIWAEGQDSTDLERVARDVDVADALSHSIVGEYFARALLLNNVGAIYANARQTDMAMRFYEQARAVLQDVPNPDIELSAIDFNIGMASPNPTSRKAALASVVRRRTEVLGEHHPQTLNARLAAAIYGDDPHTALTALRPVCDDLRAHQPTLVGTYIGCERELAVVAEYDGDVATMVKALGAVVEAGGGDPDVLPWVKLSSVELALATAESNDAAVELTSIVESAERGHDVGDRADAAEAKLYLARLAAIHSDRARSNRLAQSSLDAFVDIARTDFNLIYALRVEQAKALVRH